MHGRAFTITEFSWPSSWLHYIVSVLLVSWLLQKAATKLPSWSLEGSHSVEVYIRNCLSLPRRLSKPLSFQSCIPHTAWLISLGNLEGAAHQLKTTVGRCAPARAETRREMR